MTDPDVARGNRLCAQLSEGVLDRLVSAARLITFPLGQPAISRDEPVTTAYFPLTGMASVLALDSSGATVEIATIGREGFVGVIAMGADGNMPFDVIWQLPGSALAVRIDVLRELAATNEEVGRMVARYTSALLTQVGQNAGCNRLHRLRQRCAKWLLLTLDRAESESFPLTQEFLAMMLGVTRSKVTMTAQEFQGMGHIAQRRGSISVLDRAGLEEQACECYEVIRRAYVRLAHLPSDAS